MSMSWSPLLHSKTGRRGGGREINIHQISIADNSLCNAVSSTGNPLGSNVSILIVVGLILIETRNLNA